MPRTVAGLFDQIDHARSAARELMDAGHSRGDISIIANQRVRTDTLSPDADDAPTYADDAARGAGIGATAGALVGGTAALFAGLGALAVPGVGPILAAGPIVAFLTGAGLGAGVGAALGGVAGVLTKNGVAEAEARVYEEGVRRGGVLLTLTTPDHLADRAGEILLRHGAADIESRAAEYGVPLRDRAAATQGLPIEPIHPADRAKTQTEVQRSVTIAGRDIDDRPPTEEQRRTPDEAERARNPDRM